MSRPVKSARHDDAEPITVAGMQPGPTGATGPATFDGRSNLRGPAPKEVVNRDAGTGGKSLIATRVP